MRIQHWVFLMTLFASNVSYAQAPQINVRTDPALSASQRTYEEALKSLTPEQVAQLKELDGLATEAEEPNFEIISKTAAINACTVAYDEAKKTEIRNMMQGFTIDRIGQNMKLRRDIGQKIKNIDFIDKQVLTGHLSFQRNLSTQLLVGMSDVAVQRGIYDQAKCEEELGELTAKYAQPYAPSVTESFDQPGYTEYVGMTIKNCDLTLGSFGKDNHLRSIALVYAQSTDGSHFEFSGKVYNPERQPLPIADLWINFGKVDTRLTAQTNATGTPLLIGRFNGPLMSAVLTALRDNQTIVSIQTTDETQPYKFIPAATTADDINKMASCITIITPSLTESFKNAGFVIDPQMVERRTINPAEILQKK